MKEKASKLTIILTIAGREMFTQRWLRYMNDIQCPYKILIGDNKNDTFFDNPKHLFDCYQNLDVEYIRYESDVTMNSYFMKLKSLVDMVDTEYVLFADNDDFYLLDYFNKYIDFLDNSPDYVSARGSAGKFFICSHFNCNALSQVAGQRYIAFNVVNKSIEQQNSLERVDWFLGNIESSDVFFNWYSIARIGKVREILDILSFEKDIDPFVHELMYLVLMLQEGKIKVFDDFGLLRQEGSSQCLSLLISRHPHAFRRIFIENKWQALYNILDKTFPKEDDNKFIRISVSKQLEKQIATYNIQPKLVDKIINKIKIKYSSIYSVLYVLRMYIYGVFGKQKYIKSPVLDRYVISCSKSTVNNF